jgi:hypothetical protein
MKLLSWQIRTTLLIGVVGPPVASLVLMTGNYLPWWEGGAEPIDVPGFVAAFLLFGLPVGFAFGVIPALLAGALYCTALTALSSVPRGMLTRVCLGAIAGELIGEVWFHGVMGLESYGYGPVAALVTAVLSAGTAVRPQVTATPTRSLSDPTSRVTAVSARKMTRAGGGVSNSSPVGPRRLEAGPGRVSSQRTPTSRRRA